MSSLQDIVASSLDYSLTWCVHGWQDPFECDWIQEPSLVIVQIPEATCRLAVRENGSVKQYRGTPGDAFILPAGTVHKFAAPGCFTSGINIQYMLFSSVDVLQLYRVPVRVDSAYAAEIAECIANLVVSAGEIQLPGSDRPDDEIDLVSIAQERELAFQLLAKVLRISEMRPRGRQRLLALQKMSRPLRFLEDNLEERVRIEDLADVAGLSVHRFSTIFKSVVGVTPHQYILRRRVDKAMKLLSSSDTPVRDIAFQLGFHDQPHFTRLFKATIGVSPTYYRKNLQRRFQQQLRGKL